MTTARRLKVSNGDHDFATAGVDLAAQDARTGLAVLDWTADRVTARSVRVGAGNEDIGDIASQVELTGIDCPLGWPVPFTDLLLAARSGSAPAGAGSSADERRTLAFRRTDFHVRQVAGRWPLSVSADLIGYPAMRAAGLLATLAGAGLPIRRTGLGSAVAEVYPAAALRIWGLPTRGYKTDPAARSLLLEALCAAARWLDLAAVEPICRASDDALDAVVAALVAGAVYLGRTIPPPCGELGAAAEEGWIHLPDADFLLGSTVPGFAAGSAGAVDGGQR